MPKMISKSFSLVFFVGVSTMLAAQTSSAKTTVAVGNCQPQLVSYSTISEAVAAVKPHSTVLVCPGTCPEQVTISTPLTLEGLADADGALPVITVPSGGVGGMTDRPSSLLSREALNTRSQFILAISLLTARTLVSIVPRALSSLESITTAHSAL